MGLATRLQAGQHLFRQGDPPGAMYVLLDGALSVVADGVVIATIDQPGGFVGEISCLLGKPRVADVVALRASKVLVVQDMQTFMRADPNTALQVARELARRLDVMDREVVALRAALAAVAAAGSSGSNGEDLLAIPDRLHREAGRS